MKRKDVSIVLFLGLILNWLSVQAQAESGAELTAYQQTLIDRAILKISKKEGRGVAQQWVTVQKVAEFICSPLALPAIRATKETSDVPSGYFKAADRVFLGPDGPATLTLSGGQLTGEGQVRVGNDWRNFRFVCVLPAREKKGEFRVTYTRGATLP